MEESMSEVVSRGGARMRRILRAAVLGLAGVGCVAGAAVGQLAIPGELTHEYVVAAGEEVAAELLIKNTSEEPIAVVVRQADYSFSADGTNRYDEPGTAQRSNAAWIQLALPAKLIVPARGEVRVSYWIRVPDVPSLVGTYWSMLLVAPESAPTPAEPGAFGVRTVLQYGVQIVTHVGDTGLRAIHIENVQLLREPEGVVLQVDVANVGERWVRPTAWVEVYGSSGALVGRFDSGRQRVYPGTSVRHRFFLDVPAGEYKALVVFDNGDEYVWGAQYTLAW